MDGFEDGRRWLNKVEMTVSNGGCGSLETEMSHWNYIRYRHLIDESKHFKLLIRLFIYLLVSHYYLDIALKHPCPCGR